MDGPSLTGGAVHVWTVGLDAEPAAVCSLLNLLNGEERVRAARMPRTELRLRFIVAHGALRSILSRYVQISPSQLQFETNQYGKPRIAGFALSFSLSHCDAIAVCAVTSGGEVGIDIERIRSVPDEQAVVERCFAPSEAAQYQSLHASERPAAFFSTWTRKEAFLKALGTGVQHPLDSFQVDITPTESSPRLVFSGSALPEKHGFHLRSFIPAPQYIAAMALDRAIETVHFCEWTHGSWPASMSGGREFKSAPV